jgi:hypothetical protein
LPDRSFFITVSPLLSYGVEKQQQPATQGKSLHKEQYERSMEERLRKLGKQNGSAAGNTVFDAYCIRCLVCREKSGDRG